MASNGDTISHGSNAIFLANAEKVTPLGYYFAIVAVVLVSGIYLLLEFGGLVPDKNPLLVAVTDSLLIVGIIMFFAASLYGYTKAKNLRIQDTMFGFSMASFSFCFAGLAWGWYNLIEGIQVPYPSLVDVFFLVGSLATIASIYSAIRTINESTGLKVELNIIIVALAVVATVAIVMIYAAFTDILKGGMTSLALVSIAYPALDIICLTMVGNLILISHRRSIFESLVIIAAGAVILSLSHIFFSITTSIGFFKYEPLAATFYAIAYILYAIGIARYVVLTKSDLVMDRVSKLSKVQKS